MTIAVTDAWTRAVKCKDARLRYLAIIEDGTTTWKALSGSHDSLTYDAGLASLPSSVGAEVNPLTRESDINQIVIEYRDKYLRPIMTANSLRGQALTVKLGAAELPENDFCYYGSGVINTTIGDGESRIITVSCLDPFVLLRDTKITGAWVDKHPLEVLYYGDGSGVLEKVGIPDALIDTASFDPSNYTDDISHWNIVRAGFMQNLEFTLLDPRSGIKITNHIAMLLNGTLRINGDGKFTFSRFDATASEAVTWTNKEMISCRHVEEREDIVNEMIVGFWQAGSIFAENDTGRLEWKDQDTDSQATYAYKDGDPRVFSKEVTTDWINGWAHLVGTLPDENDTAMTIMGFTIAGFTGMRQSLDGPQPAEATLSAARPAYYLIRDASGTDPVIEIVKVTAANTTTLADPAKLSYTDPDTGKLEELGPFGNKMNLTTVVREQFGTSGVDWATLGGGHVHDITILVEMTAIIIKRFGNGIDIIEIVTGMGEFDKELADLVKVIDADFVGFGNDGLDGTDKYEIIQKEPRPEDNQVTWRIATAVLATPARAFFARAKSGIDSNEGLRGQIDADVTRQHVISGLVSSTSAGLIGLISTGIVSTSPSDRRPTLAQSHTYRANKDTYVAYSTWTRQFVWHDVANAAAAPDFSEDEMQIAKVVTDGVGITGHTDLRETLAIDSLDKVADGSTYLRVTGVSAGHQVQSGSISNDAVVAGKIADGGVSGSAEIANKIIGPLQTISDNVGRNHGFDVNVWSLGSGSPPDGWSIV